jgi:hypothetical protein
MGNVEVTCTAVRELSQSAGIAGYVSVCVQLYCVGFHCLSLHGLVYKAIFRCVGYLFSYARRILLRCFFFLRFFHVIALSQVERETAGKFGQTENLASMPAAGSAVQMSNFTDAIWKRVFVFAPSSYLSWSRT